MIAAPDTGVKHILFLYTVDNGKKKGYIKIESNIKYRCIYEY